MRRHAITKGASVSSIVAYAFRPWTFEKNNAMHTSCFDMQTCEDAEMNFSVIRQSLSESDLFNLIGYSDVNQQEFDLSIM